MRRFTVLLESDTLSNFATESSAIKLLTKIFTEGQINDSVCFGPPEEILHRMSLRFRHYFGKTGLCDPCAVASHSPQAAQNNSYLDLSYVHDWTQAASKANLVSKLHLKRFSYKLSP